MIQETFLLSATNTDVLVAPSRLAAIPYSGTLTLEMQADNQDHTNYFSVTLQLPNGDTPIDNQPIPKGATAGAINADDKYVVSFPVAQGGHVLIACTETGTALMSLRATLMP